MTGGATNEILPDKAHGAENVIHGVKTAGQSEKRNIGRMRCCENMPSIAKAIAKPFARAHLHAIVQIRVMNLLATNSARN